MRAHRGACQGAWALVTGPARPLLLCIPSLRWLPTLHRQRCAAPPSTSWPLRHAPMRPARSSEN